MDWNQGNALWILHLPRKTESYNVACKVLKKILSGKHAFGCVCVCLRKREKKREWGGQKILRHFGVAGQGLYSILKSPLVITHLSGPSHICTPCFPCLDTWSLRLPLKNLKSVLSSPQITCTYLEPWLASLGPPLARYVTLARPLFSAPQFHCLWSYD